MLLHLKMFLTSLQSKNVPRVETLDTDGELNTIIRSDMLNEVKLIRF
jgi:hypothetical protein